MVDNKKINDFLSLFEFGHYTYLVIIIKKALKKDRKCGIYWGTLGDAYTELGKYSKAIKSYKKAIKYSNKNNIYHSYNHLANMYSLKKDSHNAIKWFKKAIEKKTNYASAYIYLGVHYFQIGRLKSAQKLFKQATNCKHGAIDEAHWKLGLVLESRGKYEDAKHCYKNALAIDPHYKLARESLYGIELALAEQLS